MYELTVFTCWRGLVTPVPGAGAERVNGTTPSVSVNFSSGSLASNGMFATSVPPWTSPKVWSRNWAQVQPHWVTRCSEKMFWPRSWKMRLLMARTFGPFTMAPWPSAYRAAAIRG